MMHGVGLDINHDHRDLHSLSQLTTFKRKWISVLLILLFSLLY